MVGQLRSGCPEKAVVDGYYGRAVHLAEGTPTQTGSLRLICESFRAKRFAAPDCLLAIFFQSFFNAR